MSPSINGTYRVRINVVAHASARWKGATSAAQALKLNEVLSKSRADAIRKIVEQDVKAAIPNVRIQDSGGRSALGSFVLSAVGVGSQKPIVPLGPQENEAINRSAIVGLSLMSTETTNTFRYRPGQIDTLSDVWHIEILELKSIGAGVVVGYVKLRLTNPYSGKSRTYQTELLGGGYSTKIVNDMMKGKIDLERSVGNTFFSTTHKIGFNDFDGLFITVGEAAASYAIGIPKTKFKIGAGFETLTFAFRSLHTSPEILSIKPKLKVKFSESATVDVMSGRLKAAEPNPGDWIDLMVIDDAVKVHHHTSADGILVPFETGSSAVDGQTKSTLSHHVSTWAKNVRSIIDGT